jgi:hypothetical protein
MLAASSTDKEGSVNLPKSFISLASGKDRLSLFASECTSETCSSFSEDGELLDISAAIQSNTSDDFVDRVIFNFHQVLKFVRIKPTTPHSDTGKPVPLMRHHPPHRPTGDAHQYA